MAVVLGGERCKAARAAPRHHCGVLGQRLAAHTEGPNSQGLPSRTCAVLPPGPTTGSSNVTVLELRPLMLWLMELWLTGGMTCTAPPSSWRSWAEACSTRAARSCSSNAGRRCRITQLGWTWQDKRTLCWLRRHGHQSAALYPSPWPPTCTSATCSCAFCSCSPNAPTALRSMLPAARPSRLPTTPPPKPGRSSAVQLGPGVD